VSARRISTLAGFLLLSAACARPPPTFEDVPPADELFQQGLEILEGRRVLGLFPTVDYSEAIETFQAIIDNYPYSDYAVLAELRIADSYFADEKYEEALSYYRDFADLHPQHEKVPYTIFRSVLCHERRLSSAIRDQTHTRDALVHLDRLLAKYPHSEYAAEAEVMWRDLRTRLGVQIRSIADFYLAQHEFEAAAERYRSLLNQYPGLGLDAEALYKLGVCYEEMNRQDEAALIFQSVVQYYGESSVAEAAEERLARGTDWDPRAP
jgi:outer membrane protein assembly factor BamD